MAISTVTRVKVLLGIDADDESQDALLAQLLAGVEAVVEGYCHREFASSTRTEYHTGSGGHRLLLRRRPVSSVAAVYLDVNGYFGQAAGAFATATLLTPGVDYVLELDAASAAPTGALRRLGGGGGAAGSWHSWPAGPYPDGPAGTLTEGRSGPVWPAVPGCLKVTYTAGFSAMPADLMLAVDQIAARVYHEGGFGGRAVMSEKLEDYAVTYAAAAIEAMPAVGSPRQILARYREPVV